MFQWIYHTNTINSLHKTLSFPRTRGQGAEVKVKAMIFFGPRGPYLCKKTRRINEVRGAAAYRPSVALLAYHSHTFTDSSINTLHHRPVQSTLATHWPGL